MRQPTAMAVVAGLLLACPHSFARRQRVKLTPYQDTLAAAPLVVTGRIAEPRLVTLRAGAGLPKAKRVERDGHVGYLAPSAVAYLRAELMEPPSLVAYRVTLEVIEIYRGQDLLPPLPDGEDARKTEVHLLYGVRRDFLEMYLEKNNHPELFRDGAIVTLHLRPTDADASVFECVTVPWAVSHDQVSAQRSSMRQRMARWVALKRIDELIARFAVLNAAEQAELQQLITGDKHGIGHPKWLGRERAVYDELVNNAAREAREERAPKWRHWWTYTERDAFINKPFRIVVGNDD